MSYAEGHVLVTFENIGQAATDCDVMNADMAQQLSDLKSYLAPMISVWTGAASENYQNLQRQWDMAADDLSQILSQISRALRVAQQNYTDTESSNAQIWSS